MYTVRLFPYLFLLGFFTSFLSKPLLAQTGCEEDYDALMALYNRTGGANWADNTNWGTGCPCDNNWYGIQCADGRVISIVLDDNQLTGSLPNEIGNLSYLRTLNLYTNSITGAIPLEIGNLDSLRNLSLARNQLKGLLPDTLANLSQLRDVRLWSNLLSGPIPNSWGRLSELRILNMHFNDLTGPLPPNLGQLGNLTTLKLGENLIDGSLPPEWEGMKSVSELGLGGNLLTGSIPEEWAGMESLASLIISDNDLSGPLPVSFGNLPNIRRITLWGNELSGAIPDSWGNMSQLGELTISSNNLNGALPASMGQLDRLKTLILFDNDFTGPLPASWGGMKSLDKFYLYDNDITGPIPEEWGGMESLRDFRAQLNQIRGPLPTNFGQLSKLVICYLSQNNIDGSLPDSWGNLPLLRGLSLQNNSLTGTLPPSYGNLKNLKDFRLQGNQLSGAVPASWAGMDSLQTLYLYSNLLEGCYPSELQTLCSRSDIRMDGNPGLGDWQAFCDSGAYLCSPEPDPCQIEFDALMALYDSAGGDNWDNKENWGTGCPCENNWYGITCNDSGRVSQLNLGSNNLVGPIPNEFCNLPNLTRLDVNRNQISSLPDSIHRLENLDYLWLLLNRIPSLPDKFGHLNKLAYLNLGSNSLSELPESFVELDSLKWVWFSGNSLTSLPDSIHKLSNLTRLIVNNNLLDSLPESIVELSKLTELRTYHNVGIGELPDSIGKLTNLRILDAFQNGLQSIPPSIGNLSNLEELTLYSNQFTTLPNSIGNLSNLKTLDLRINDNLNALPESIGNLANLNSLLIENIPNLNCFPVSMGTLCGTGLTVIDGGTTPAVWQDFCDNGTYACTPGLNPNTCQSDYDALMALYNSTDGPNWKNNTNWGTGCPCDEANPWFGVTCDSLDQVIKLEFTNNFLTGPIPPEIGDLVHLQTLTLREVCSFASFLENGTCLNPYGLSGEIPEEICNLSNLTFLWLDANELTGEIPACIGNLTNLTNLNLSGNFLSGQIPPEIGNLSNLGALRLNNNEFTGVIPPELGNLHKAGRIEIEYNDNLGGPIPSELGNDTSLTNLWLCCNNLQGEIPAELGNLTNLKILLLDNNNLTGAVPASFGNLKKVDKLDISTNQLSSLPEEIGNMEKLRAFRLHRNPLGGLPESIGNLSSLVGLRAGEINMTTLPASITNLPLLQELYINDNRLTNLPQDIGTLPLRYVDVSNNADLACYPASLSNICNDYISFLDTGTTPVDFNLFCSDSLFVCCAGSANLALGKPTTHSTTYGNGAASLAVDGITEGTTNWGDGANLQHTPNQAQPWWEVDLQATVDLESVRIYNRSNCCQDRLSNVYIFTSQSPMDPNASVQDLLNNTHVFQIAYQEAAVGLVGNFPTDLTGRYVRIQLDKTTSLHMAEVEVYGCETAQDTFPPSIPSGLFAYNIQGNTLNLGWNPAPDIGGGIGGYYVYQDGVIIDTVDTDSAFVVDLVKNTTYTFAVEAFDLAGNRSGSSNPLSVTTTNVQCENFALGKAAEQSSTYGDGVASFAVDGNRTGNTNWEPNPDLQHTASEPQPWWQVDLEKTIIMDSILVFNRSNSDQERLNNFYVLISQQPFANGATLTELLNDASVYQQFYNSSVEPFYTFYPNTTGRYVRIQLASTANVSLHMAEVEVYGCEVEGDSLSPSVPQNLTVSNEMGNSLDLSWDASTDEGFSGVAGYYIYQDGIRIDSTSESTYVVGGLQTGTSYQFHVAAYDFQGNVSELGGPVYGTTTYDNCGNLALNKPAEQSSTYGNSDPAFAVDGTLTGDNPWEPNPNLQHTANQAQAWWQVDLGLLADLDSVVLYNRTGGRQDRLRNFYVLVSSTPFDGQANLQDLLADPAIGQLFNTDSPSAKYVIPTSLTGRYVRIQLSTTAATPLHMAEVQVFGCENLGPPAPEGKTLQELVNCTQVANSTSFIPDRFEDPDRNYIKSVTFRQDQSTTPNNQKDWESITYLDGLGRSIQAIEYQASPTGLDIVTPIEYDPFGRQTKSYLPFAHDNPNLPGNYKNDWEGDQPAFYQNLASISGDRSNPVALTQFEASPLNRPVEQGAPGTAWQPNSGTPGLQVANTEHTVVTAYATNSADVLGFSPESLENTDIDIIGDYYPANSLHIVRVIDENGALSETGTDKLGRTIYKSVQVEGSIAVDPLTSDNFATTYFVYDQFGNVRFVIQPEGWKSARTQGITATIKEDFCFQYRYDARQRVKAKKVPGADWVYMVYDKLDRVVATQDGNLEEKNEWLVTKYDYLGRPVMTGISKLTQSRDALQADVDANSQVYETPQGDRYTNDLAPQISTGEFHSITYYDTYSFLEGLSGYGFQAGSSLGFLESPTGVEVAYEAASSNQGRVTGVRVFVLDTDEATAAGIPVDDNELLTVTYYDKYGREIQTIADNHLGGKEFVANRYNFAGELLESVQIHQWEDAEKEQRIHKAFVYDHRARLDRGPPAN